MNQAEYLAGIAKHYFYNGDIRAAHLNAQHAFQLDNGNSQALEILAYVNDALGNRQAAVKYLHQSVLAKSASADALYYFGNFLMQEEKYQEAIVFLKRALALEPKAFQTLHDLGVCYAKDKQSVDAFAMFKAAEEINPQHPQLRKNIVNACFSLRNYDLLLTYSEPLIAQGEVDCDLEVNHALAHLYVGNISTARELLIDVTCRYPDSIYALDTLAEVLQHCGEIDSARECFTKALSISPDDAKTNFHFAMFLLSIEEYEEGWQKYEYRLQGELEKDAKRHTEIPVATTVDQLVGRTLLVWAEQGFGDVVQFARYIPKLIHHGIKVILETQTATGSLYQQLGCMAVIEKGQPFPVSIDYQLPIMSLPFLLKEREPSPTSGYLSVSVECLSKWEQIFLSKIKRHKIGIACSGNQLHVNDFNRSLPLSFFQTLQIDADFYIIQKEINEDDKVVADKLGYHFMGEDLDDFSDTAALVMQMDLIITVDTSLAHISGALGKETIVLLPFKADWRWLNHGERSNWYSSVSLIRQSKAKDWQGVFSSLNTKLEERLNNLSNHA